MEMGFRNKTLGKWNLDPPPPPFRTLIKLSCVGAVAVLAATHYKLHGNTIREISTE